jgi:acetyl-CoA synthetase
MSEKESIRVLSSEERTFPPSAEMSKKAHIGSIEQYEEMYKKSVEDPEGFWGEIAQKMGQGARV